MSKIHCLKTWPIYYEAIKSGNKTFEIRKNDRDFAIGDVLVLQEFDITKDSYTGEMFSVKITYIMSPTTDILIHNVINSDYVVLGIKILEVNGNEESK